MANLQIKGIDDEFYAQIKKMASSENRSLSQQVLFLLKAHLAKDYSIRKAKTPAKVLLELSGSWEDSRAPDQIVKTLRGARKKSKKLSNGF